MGLLTAVVTPGKQERRALDKYLQYTVTGEKKTEIRNQQRQRERERERDQKNMKGKERDIVTGEKKTETRKKNMRGKDGDMKQERKK